MLDRHVEEIPVVELERSILAQMDALLSRLQSERIEGKCFRSAAESIARKLIAKHDEGKSAKG